MAGKLLSKSVEQKIKKLITSGKLQPGDQIPSEQELSAEFNVSRSTVREAVKILVSKNILTIEWGKGTFVSENPGLSDDPLGLDFMQPELVAEDLCEIRIVLEPQVGALAARRATADEIEEMGKIVQESEAMLGRELSGTLDLMSENDIAFHSVLYRMSHNLITERLIPVISQAVMETYTHPTFRKDYNLQHCVNTHRNILEAIKAKDRQAAFAQCRHHMMRWSAHVLVGDRAEGIIL